MNARRRARGCDRPTGLTVWPRYVMSTTWPGFRSGATRSPSVKAMTFSSATLSVWVMTCQVGSPRRKQVRHVKSGFPGHPHCRIRHVRALGDLGDEHISRARRSRPDDFDLVGMRVAVGLRAPRFAREARAT